ncbi:FadR/GntR family transcriptional regulator [Pseudonocardia ailaonensis]|uniref:FadR/GntR family transcriptional regulator n=1 Tax=Pseudonocardia ailaonensis TaxID=367279 RepID=A0ABN2N3F0_9PSEU
MAANGVVNGLSIDPVRPAYEQVSVKLRTLIGSGQLKVGDRLPTEADLAKMLKVSRTTVREALRVLTSEGLVETSRGTTGGTFVRRPDPALVSEALRSRLSVLVTSDVLEVAEVIEARILLEVPAARLAAERRTEEQLARIVRTSKAKRTAAGPEERVVDHTDFHLAVLEASQNRLISALAKPVYDVLMETVRKHEPGAIHTDDDHARIVDAITRRDGAAAAEAMESHLAAISDIWRVHLGLRVE